MEIIPDTEDNFVSGYADDHDLINSFHPENTDFLYFGFKHFLHPRLDG